MNATNWRAFFFRKFAAIFFILLLCAALRPALADPALAMHGAPALPGDFDHLPYAHADAPKGGRLRLAYLGAFDSLNPFNVRALSTAQGLVGNVYQSLMFRSADEPFTLYGLVAKSIETSAERDRVVFRLDPRAHFSDGAPITAEDVLFTFRLLREKGRPQQRAAYRLVVAAEAPDAQTVRFDLTGAGDRELPLTLSLMPVLSKAHVDAEHFDEQTLQIPVGSGPYRISEVQPGERLLLKRDPDYWALNLPVMRGLYNFDEIEILYFRDSAAMFEAFKAGLIDYRIEDDATRWLTGYDFPAALAFEILVHNRQEERLALAYAQSLARIGVAVRVRLVDEVQFLRRRDRFDFDVITGLWAGTPSPGAEQRGRWGSSEAANEGSFNLMGARSPAIDAAIEALLAARERDEFVTAARALDRAALSGFDIVPFFHAPDVWIAYAAGLGRPTYDPLFGPAIETWWRQPD